MNSSYFPPTPKLDFHPTSPPPPRAAQKLVTVSAPVDLGQTPDLAVVSAAKSTPSVEQLAHLRLQSMSAALDRLIGQATGRQPTN